jgi:protein-disulfide isomerase
MNKLFASLALSLLASTCKPEAADNSARPAEAPAGDVAPVGAPDVAASAAPWPKPARPKDDVAAPAVRVPIDGLPSFGSARALVTIVAFTDYECPYCAKADARLATLRAEYGDRVRLVVASHPLAMHEEASPAARAFLAAVEQGKGEAMHLRLFAKASSLDVHAPPFDDDAVVAAAREVGLDLASFDRARKASSTEAALRHAEGLATTLSVDGTPTFFVNGRRLVGARPIEAFRALIDEELAKAQALVEKGIAPERVYAATMEAAPTAVPVKDEVEAEPAAIVDVGIEGAPLRGGSRAPITIVLFSDFECPFCVKLEKTLRAVEAENPGKLRLAFRQKPLPFHTHARLAAKASLAAERQGRFWEYHDVLLEHRDALAREDLERYAVEVGLDRARFVRDLDDPAIEARVAADEKQAEQLDVRGTPTAFVNGRRIVGAQPLSVWRTAVERAHVR